MEPQHIFDVVLGFTLMLGTFWLNSQAKRADDDRKKIDELQKDLAALETHVAENYVNNSRMNELLKLMERANTRIDDLFNLMNQTRTK